jgi:hypothetical protein
MQQCRKCYSKSATSNMYNSAAFIILTERHLDVSGTAGTNLTARQLGTSYMKVQQF